MANFGDILSSLTIGAGKSVRRNAGNSAFEAFTALESTATFNFNGTDFFAPGGINIGTADTDITVCGILVKTARSYPLMLRNSAGSNLFYVDSTGTLTLAGGITFSGSPTLSNISTVSSDYFTDKANTKAYLQMSTTGIGFHFNNRTASNITAVIAGHASQTANLLEVRGLSSKTTSVDKDANLVMGNAIQPASMADSSAPNNSIYYSTTQSKLVYKTSGGVVNVLY